MARKPRSAKPEPLDKGKMAGHGDSVKNAYTEARRIAPGCQHMLGCKCDTPFWLRDATAREIRHEEIYIRTGWVPGCLHPIKSAKVK